MALGTVAAPPPPSPPRRYGRTEDRGPRKAAPGARATLPANAVLGPPIHSARPLDWTGALVVLASWVLVLNCAIVVLLVRLPASWVELAAGSVELARVLLGCTVVLVVAWIRPFVVARLPRAASLFGRTLSFRSGGRRRRVKVAEITRAELEVRPPPAFEVIVVELADGTAHEVCPIDWPGAARLFRALGRRVASVRPSPPERGKAPEKERAHVPAPGSAP